MIFYSGRTFEGIRMNFSNYPLLTLLSVLVFLFLGTYSVRYRKLPGGTFFIVSMFLIAINSVASIFELKSNVFEMKLAWRNIQQIPLFLSPVFFLGTVMELIGADRSKVNRRLLLLGIPALVYLLLVFTDSFHHWIRAAIHLEEYGQFSRIRVESTVLSLLFIAYTRVVGFLAIALLFFNLRKVSHFYKKQYVLVLGGLLIPYIITFIGKFTSLEISAASASIPTGVLLYYALFHYKFLRVKPLALEKVFTVMDDGIIILDANGIILDANPAGIRVLKHLANPDSEYSAGTIYGQKIERQLYCYPELIRLCKENTPNQTQIQRNNHHYSVRFLPLSKDTWKSDALLMFTDITERRHYENDLYQRATVDSLTGLYNRQHLLELTNLELNRREERSSPLCLLLIDIDFFKDVNDLYGHQTGDYALETLAQLLREEVNSIGFAGRMGGEEFAVVLPNTPIKQAFEFAERIRKKTEQLELITAPDGEAVHFTISIGISEARDREDTFKRLYHYADESLYASKRSGRNRTTIYSVQ
jgi:diguanylate cyclase